MRKKKEKKYDSYLQESRTIVGKVICEERRIHLYKLIKFISRSMLIFFSLSYKGLINFGPKSLETILTTSQLILDPKYRTRASFSFVFHNYYHFISVQRIRTRRSFYFTIRFRCDTISKGRLS